MDRNLAIVICCILGLAFATILTKVKNTPLLQKILDKINFKTVEDDIFDYFIDYSQPPFMQISIKDSDLCYSGFFLYREEKGDNSWIALKVSECIDKHTLKIKMSNNNREQNYVILVNLRDIEKIEILYDDNSTIWKKLNHS